MTEPDALIHRRAAAARPSPAGGLPPSWDARAARLRGLLAALAHARHTETQAFARAFLGAAGAPMQQREQAARLAAAGAHLAAELAAADVAAYQLQLKAALGEVWTPEGMGS